MAARQEYVSRGGVRAREAHVVAERDVFITDHRGLRVQIVAGTVVPRPFVDAYNDEVGARGTRRARGPQTDKAERAPQTDK